ncbi:MAG: hypothetical protein KC488_03885 [Candidatus Cloacimonetes bacterium]|nr:hypothetical protein [Candidatus Cloacimonadota bacterium]
MTLESRRVVLYIGAAGGRISPLRRGTLFRGVSEAQSQTFSQNRGSQLDLDFVVGAAIRHFEERGWVCTWKHICDDPGEELTYVLTHAPILQDRDGRLGARFRLRDAACPWQLSKESVSKARKLLARLFDEAAIKSN